MRALKLVLKLGRLKMTVFSAVTYGTAASVANLALVEAGAASEFDPGLFLAGWAFVFFTQLVAHFLGEYYDLPSDKLNCHAGPLTGGSKVLMSGDISPRQCFALGYACLGVAGSILAFVLPHRCLIVGIVLMCIAHQYSAPPFRCNHRGLGELTAALASNVLLPQFAAVVQSDAFEAPAATLGLFHSSLAMLVVPAFCLKINLFLTLNMADRRADWLGAKYTLPVILGDEVCSRILGALSVLAYVSAVGIFLAGLCPATTLAAILLTAPEALSIARAFNPSWQLLPGENDTRQGEGGRGKKKQRPYRLEGLVVRVLKHAPGAVLAIFADTVLREAVAAGTAAAEGSGGDSFTWKNWLLGVAGVLCSTSLAVRCLPLVPFVYLFFLTSPAPPKPSSSATTTAGGSPAAGTDQQAGVVVAGGGVGGLVLGACLQELGLPFEILEKSLSGEDTGGADLALWPAATKILKELGVGSTESAGADEFVDLSDFWGRKTYPVRAVRICKVDPDKPLTPQEAPAADGGSSSTGGGSSAAAGGEGFVAAEETVLTKVDMDAVVAGEGEPFRLVGRQAVMSALLPLVDEANVRRGARVVRAEQATPPKTLATAHIVQAGRGSGGESSAGRLSCRVLVGADGIHSVCRMEVSAAAAALSDMREDGGGAGSSSPNQDLPAAAAVAAVRATGARDGGEVCYRGVLDLRDGSPAAKAGLRAVFEGDEARRPSSMSVVYGDRIRYSWGFIDGARETGYWFVKQLTGEKGGGGEGTKEEGGGRLGEGWPEPLKTFAKMTGEECSYAHRIQDRPPLDRWSCGNITLLGDACHPATPNNGQGACMAIEDALVLSTLLAEYWDQPDGHVEAFYLYERARLAHTKSVQGESLKQMKLGQLTSRAGIWVRERVISALPPSVLQKKLRAANVFDVDPWLDRFRVLKAKRA